MKIDINKQGEQTVISLDGMLDSSSAPEFQQIVTKELEKEQLNLVFDLAKMTYTSSQGIRTFLTILKTAMQRDGKVVFRHIVPAVREIFNMSGISQAMTIEE